MESEFIAQRTCHKEILTAFFITGKMRMRSSPKTTKVLKHAQKLPTVANVKQLP